MLIKLATGQIYYDLTGPENGQVVCFTHSLASDGGMWAEQLPPLLAAGYRVLRLDMRGHGGSDAVAGDYTMEQLADDVAGSLDFLGIKRCSSSASRSAACWARRSPSSTASGSSPRCSAIPPADAARCARRHGRRASTP